jgi:hypothetical protein
MTGFRYVSIREMSVALLLVASFFVGRAECLDPYFERHIRFGRAGEFIRQNTGSDERALRWYEKAIETKVETGGEWTGPGHDTIVPRPDDWWRNSPPRSDEEAMADESARFAAEMKKQEEFGRLAGERKPNAPSGKGARFETSITLVGRLATTKSFYGLGDGERTGIDPEYVYYLWLDTPLDIRGAGSGDMNQDGYDGVNGVELSSGEMERRRLEKLVGRRLAVSGVLIERRFGATPAEYSAAYSNIVLEVERITGPLESAPRTSGRGRGSARSSAPNVKRGTREAKNESGIQ